ncbi:MAG: hypothetical protein LBW85_14020 [Deltaproteobacteria bacterium]|nr:hypothetical protein [Deltaproteobacteria bacterium]
MTYYESYKSVIEALSHAGVRHGRRVDIRHLEADDFRFQGLEDELGPCDGILVPGGFGDRGYEQMLEVIRYARESGKPFFGICFGLQLAIVEYARNVLGLPHASSEELRSPMDPPGEDFIYFMSSWYNYKTARIVYRKRDSSIGGTMRLGLQPCFLNPGTKAFAAYSSAWSEGKRRAQRSPSYAYDEVPLTHSPSFYRTAFNQEIDPKTLADLEKDAREKGLLTVYERHRHRYEINPAYHGVLTAGPAGGGDRFLVSGEAPKFTVPEQNAPPHIVEIMELERHPWFLGCQFHPEFLSRPLRPHPLFQDFVRAAADYRDGRKGKTQAGS